MCKQTINHVLILIRILDSSYDHKQHERLVASLVHHQSEDSNLPIFYDTDDTEEGDASNKRQKKREAEEADKVEVAPGVTAASLKRFRTALIGPTQRLLKRRRSCR